MLMQKNARSKVSKKIYPLFIGLCKKLLDKMNPEYMVVGAKLERFLL